MKIIGSIVRYIFVLALSMAVVYLFENQFTYLFNIVYFGQTSGGSFINLTELAIGMFGLMVAVPFLLISLGDRARYLVTAGFIIIAMMPDIVVPNQYVFLNFITMLAAAVAGVIVRYGVYVTFGKVPTLAKYKKYF